MTKEILDYGVVETITTVKRDWTGTENELHEALIAGVPIYNFEGGAEVPASRLTKSVPEGLPFSSKPVMIDEEYESTVFDDETGEEKTITLTRKAQAVDGEGEGINCQKTWGEYAIVSESITEGKYLLLAVDYVSASKCHSGAISSENLHIWANDVGISNMRTKSEFRDLRKIEDPETTDNPSRVSL